MFHRLKPHNFAKKLPTHVKANALEFAFGRHAGLYLTRYLEPFYRDGYNIWQPI
jgi:hypothetical protein